MNYAPGKTSQTSAMRDDIVSYSTVVGQRHFEHVTLFWLPLIKHESFWGWRNGSVLLSTVLGSFCRVVLVQSTLISVPSAHAQRNRRAESVTQSLVWLFGGLCQLASYSSNKHHDQKQCGNEGFVSSYTLQSTVGGSQGRNLRQKLAGASSFSLGLLATRSRGQEASTESFVCGP